MHVELSCRCSDGFHALCCAVPQAMVKAGGQLVEEHGPLLSEVLREAYVAVVREGVLLGSGSQQMDMERTEG